MLSLANTLVARAARLIQAANDEPALWTISANGQIVGSVVCEAGTWRLSWFKEADPRLVSYGGVVDGDLEALATSLGARLGSPVCLDSLTI